MCGIVGILEINRPAEVGTLRRRALTMAKKIRHRGPDWSGVFCDDRAVLAHERLSIVDVEHGAQPLRASGEEGESRGSTSWHRDPPKPRTGH